MLHHFTTMNSNDSYELADHMDDPLKEIDDGENDRDDVILEFGYFCHFSPPTGCDNCHSDFEKRRYGYGSKSCLHCGTWCRSCLDPKNYNWWFIEEKEKKKYVDKVTKINKDWRMVDVLMPKGYSDAGELKLLEANTCPNCDDEILLELDDALGMYFSSARRIIISYVDYEELTVVKYNYDRQRFKTTCKICGEIRAIANIYFEQRNNIICSRCNDHIVVALRWNIRTYTKLMVSSRGGRKHIVASEDLIDNIMNYIDMDVVS